MVERTDLRGRECPVARGLGEVGEWWSILILRDAFHGLTRFDEFRESLGVAPNILSRRLSGLVEAGLLARQRYSEHPPRDAYRLTQKGRDFQPVLIALMAWGNRHLAGPDGPAVVALDRATGEPVEPVLVDARTGAPLSVRLAPGPGAGPEIHARVALIERARARRQGDGADQRKEPAR